jgi:hypothetical protein
MSKHFRSLIPSEIFCNDNEASPQRPPPPRFAWSPSPAARGRKDMRSRSRDAARPRLADRSYECLRLKQNEGRRSAGRRNCLGAAPAGAARATDDLLAQTIRFGRARLSALHRGFGLRFSGLRRFDSRPGFLGRGPAGFRPPFLSQSSGSTPRAGRNAGGHDAWSRPGAVCETARRHRAYPASLDRIRNAPFDGQAGGSTKLFVSAVKGKSKCPWRVL